MSLNITNEDCMDLMARYPDKYFELAIVDPPYGLGKGKTSVINPHDTKNSLTRFQAKEWDNAIPPLQYFEELKRVSKNQIIWGGNYFPLSCYRTFIVWDKMTYIPTMSQVELAYTSFEEPARMIKINSNQFDRIHPTQKPVALYNWLLKNYAKEGDKILDTHLGSGSIAIACHYMGFDLTACELDKEYYDAAMERITNQTRQITLL